MMMMRRLKQTKSLLRRVLHGLAALLILALPGVLLVSHTSEEEVVRRSDYTVATVRVHWLKWRQFQNRWMSGWGGGHIAVIVRITDAERSLTWWSMKHERPFLAVDHAGGYFLATQYASVRAPGIRGYWLGPDGGSVRGFRRDLPLSRMVQNLRVDAATQEALAHFDPALLPVRQSLTARLWWKIWRGTEVPEVPEDYVRAVLKENFPTAPNLTPEREKMPLSIWGAPK